MDYYVDIEWNGLELTVYFDEGDPIFIQSYSTGDGLDYALTPVAVKEIFDLANEKFKEIGDMMKEQE